MHIHCAAISNKVEVAKVLVEKGGDKEAKSNEEEHH